MYIGRVKAIKKVMMAVLISLGDFLRFTKMVFFGFEML